MPDIYTIRLGDGRIVEVESDHEPTESEVMAALGEQVQRDTPAQSPASTPVVETATFNPLSFYKDLAVGAAKGAGNTIANLGELINLIPGFRAGVDAMYGQPGLSEQAFADVKQRLVPTNDAQGLGQAGEQIAEFLLPAGAAEKTAAAIASRVPRLGRMIPRIATEAAATGAVAKAQGGDPATMAAMGAAGPVVGKGASAIGRGLDRLAPRLVRAGIKPTVTAMKQQAGASRAGITRKADELVQFIIDNRITSPDKAQAIVDGAEAALQTAIRRNNAPTDAPKRAMRYLAALRASAAKQGLGAEDVAAIESAMTKLVDGPYGEDIVTTVMRPSSILDASGNPMMTPTQDISRALRADMPADEALSRARASSQWSTRKQWGEMKGATAQSEKAVESATRSAVKNAVPGAGEALARERLGITARQALDRQAFREGNRDVVSLPAHVIAAGELASGKVPVLSFASNWLRDNQLRAGIYADRLAKAIGRKDVGEVMTILGRLGVGTAAQATR